MQDNTAPRQPHRLRIPQITHKYALDQSRARPHLTGPAPSTIRCRHEIACETHTVSTFLATANTVLHRNSVILTAGFDSNEADNNPSSTASYAKSLYGRA